MSPTGTVTFYDGTTTIATVTVGSGGQAVFTTSNLSVGSHQITSSYSGDSLDLPSSSSAVSLEVAANPTETTISTSSTSLNLGQSATFTANVSNPNVGVPSGSVSFYSGTTLLGTSDLNAIGVATFSSSAFSVGTASLTAIYSGDTNNLSSSSLPVVETIAPDTTTTSVSASVDTIDFGELVSFTANVVNSLGAATPTGSVAFYDGTTEIGTTNVSSNGSAVLATSSLPVASASITAVYSGDSNDLSSTSATISETINADPTTTVLTSSTTSINLGQSPTFTATVTNPSGATEPTGSVDFYSGSTLLGAVSLSSNGTAELSSSAFAVGTSNVTAVYSGDTDDLTSTSSAVIEAVSADPTTTTVSLSPATTNLGQAVTITANVVNPSGAAVPTGSVSFYVGSTFLGTGSLGTNDLATYTASHFGVGSYKITAVYSGDTDDRASSSTTSVETVNPDPTTTSITSSASTINFGQLTTFTATVVNPSGAAVPTGTVSFYTGSTLIDTATLNANSQASYSTSSLAVGTTNVTVIYSGDTNDLTSTSSAIAETINPDPTTTGLSASAASISLGQSVTITATVANPSGAASPSGTVRFYTGGALLGSGTLNSSGQASFTTTHFAIGSINVTAIYSGDTDDQTSTSGSLTETINPDPTTTTISTSASSIIFGQAVTFTASVVNPTGAAVPTGSVMFYGGSTLLGSGTLNSNDKATFTTSGFAVGSTNVTAVYSGDTSDLTSSSSTMAESVTPDPTTTTVSTSVASIDLGQSTTLTAQVLNPSGGALPTGPVNFYSGTTLLGSAMVGTNGIAALSTANFVVGSASITAVYCGDLDDLPSTSSALYETVNPDPTTMWVSASAAAITLGQSVSFTANVINSYGAVAPTGSVSFYVGSTLLGTGTVNSNAEVTFTTSAFAVGLSSVTAEYSGDSNDLADTSAPMSLTVAPDPTTTTLSDSVSGQSVSLTAHVVNPTGAATPTGSVSFYTGTTLLGSSTLSASGLATLTEASSAIGSAGVFAVYSGDISDLSSSSQVLGLSGNGTPNSTTTTLVSSASTIDFGQSATLTATVTNPTRSGKPTGTVNFYLNTALYGSGTLNSNGQVTLTASGFAVGTADISAVYQGDANDPASTSATLAETIVAAPTTTSLSTSVASIDLGQLATFTAHVVNPSVAASPTGPVNFYSGSTLIGSAMLGGNGTAALSTLHFAVGSANITAVYCGDLDDQSSTSSILVESINRDPTTMSVSASAASITLGQSETITAHVVNSYGAVAPTGSVSFYVGTTLLGSGTVNTNAQATFTTSSLMVGSASITAVYSGDTNDLTYTSSVIEVSVNPDPTTTTVSASVASINLGQSVSFTAHVVNPSGAAVPTGSVSFYAGSKLLGSTSINTSGLASLTTSSLAVGSANVTAVYSGDTNDLTSTSSGLAETVYADPTTTTMVSSASTINFGQSETFTATVVNPSGAAVPTGTVKFFSGNKLLGSGTLNSIDQATFTSSRLAVGTSSITAVYSGDTDDLTSSSSGVTLLVNPDATTTAISSSVSSLNLGQMVTFTATVVNPSGAIEPTGTANFYVGTSLIGSGTLNNNGQASFSTSKLTVGSASVKAVYEGDIDDLSSSSSALSVTVNPDPTSTVVYSSAPTIDFGQTVTYTATVINPSGAAVPTGTVKFYSGTTLLGSGPLNSNDQATFSTSHLAVGSSGITAVYSGDTNDRTSTSSSKTQVVNPDPTVTAVSATASAINLGQPVTFTANVVNPSGAIEPTGSVNFYDGSTLLGSGTLNAQGQASLRTLVLPLGSTDVVAIYQGDVDDAPSSSSAHSESVSEDVTTTTVSSSSTTVGYGTKVTYTATIINTSSSLAPTGTVLFFLGGNTEIGTCQVTTGLHASITTDVLPVGSDSIVAVYEGDTNDLGSFSAPITETVNQAVTSTTLTTSSSTISYGNTVTLSATVSSQSLIGTPTGSVSFFESGVLIGSAPLNASGVALFPTSILSAGEDSLTATYNGDTNNQTSTSGSYSETVNPGVVLQTSENTAVFGQPVTLTATLGAWPGSSPNGTVVFSSGGLTLGSVPINSSDQAQLTLTTLPVGSSTITAAYSGDTTNSACVSSPVNVSVSAAQTFLTLTTSQATPTAGQEIILTATVTTTGNSSATPTGWVVFNDGSTVLGNVILDNVGIARITTALSIAGAQSVTAVFLPSPANFLGSMSAGVAESVSPAAAARLAVAMPNTASPGSPVTLHITAYDAYGNVATGYTGTVQFVSTDTAAILPSNLTFTASNDGVATSYVTFNTGGSQILTVTDVSNPLLNSVVPVVVGTPNSNAVPTTTTISLSPPTTVDGQGVTISTSVSETNGTGIPTGRVFFFIGDTKYSSATLNSSGNATVTLYDVPVGQSDIVVTYLGDPLNLPSASPIAVETVTSNATVPTTTALALSPTTSIIGSAVTLTATVAAPTGSAVPTGEVDFFLNGYKLGSGTLSANGQATITSSAIPAGVNDLYAIYRGNTTDETSTSSTVTETVNLNTSVLNLTSSAASISYGQSVTFTATVVVPDGIATGKVHFYFGNSDVGSAYLNSNGVATLTLSNLDPGTASLYATYSGDQTNAGSTSAPISLTVTPAATTTTLTLSSNTVTAGTSVTLTASVATTIPGSNIPIGYVDFMNGTTLIGQVIVDANGQSSMSLTLTQAGTFSFTATYLPGSSKYLGSTSTVQNETVSAGAASQLVIQTSPAVGGQPATATIRAVDAYGNTATTFVGTLAFSSTDTNATLPPNLIFIAADNGIATINWPFVNDGQTVTVFDIANTSISGSLTLPA